MPILEQLNEVKDIFKNILDHSVVDLPESILPKFTKQLTQIIEEVNNLGNYVEKHFKDQIAKRQMQVDIEKEMNESSLYRGLSAAERVSIADKITKSSGLELLDEQGFREHLTKFLSKLPDDKLVLKAYSKQDIIGLGRSLTSPGASVGIQYQAGLKSLNKLISTPDGFEEAVAYGIDRILKDPVAKKHYLFSYYGIDNAKL